MLEHLLEAVEGIRAHLYKVHIRWHIPSSFIPDRIHIIDHYRHDVFSSFYSEKKKGTNADLVLQEARKWFRANTVQATLESDRWESKFEQHKKHSSLFRSV